MSSVECVARTLLVNLLMQRAAFSSRHETASVQGFWVGSKAMCIGSVMLRSMQCERPFGFGMKVRAWRASVRGDKKGRSRRDHFHRRLAIASVLPHRAVDE